MRSTIQTGNKEVIEFLVTEQMTPKFHEKVIHQVCSTWDLTHQFEIVSRMTLEPHLEDSEQGIGSYISVDHVKPAPVGKTVVVEAIITELEETSVTCELKASIGEVVVATGKQIQRILPIEAITKIINKANDY